MFFQQSSLKGAHHGHWVGRAASSLLFVLGAGSIASAGGVQRVPVADSLHPALFQSRQVGVTHGSKVLHIAVNLQPSDPDGLAAFCESVSDPKSIFYGQFITPKEVGDRFGASASDRQAVANFLASKGIKVTLVAPNGMEILADATVRQAQAAFGTTIGEFVGPSPEGTSQIHFQANTSTITLPSSVQRIVSGVTGLETYTRPQFRATTSTLTPTLTRALYNTAPLYAASVRGQGRTIGISNWDGFRIANVSKYITNYALPVPAAGATKNISTVKIDGGSGTGTPQGEGDLDIQMVVGTAPLATIIIYDGGANLIDVLTKEATDNTADIISESYGWNLTAADATAAHNQHLAMTAQGITYLAATGDSGTTVEPYSYPNYDGEVLMIGGTVATVNSTTGVRSSEVGWSGSGGGYTTKAVSFNVRPSWQVGTGVPTTLNYRLFPDVSLHASGTSGGAYYFYYNNRLTGGYVGTSFACPVFAGCLGIAEQQLITLGKLPTFGTKRRYGRLQNLIYSQNGRSDVYYDILSGSNGKLANGSTSSATVGWDTVTGWGSFNFNGFVNSIP